MTKGQKSLSSKSYFTGNLESEIRKLFSDYNISVQIESPKEASLYCPFHKNTHSPAFNINLRTGLWQCFNPSCDKRGNFRQLYKHITGKSFYRESVIDPTNLKYEIEQGLVKKEDKAIDLASVEVDYGSDDVVFLSSLVERGYDLDTLEYLDVGYSKLKQRIVIPVRDAHFRVVGLIGRATLDGQEPRYLYNTGFKRAEVLFNIQNAKHFDECIVVEGSLDCAKVIQAGFKNCVATLGAMVSAKQVQMLRKYFDKIIIFSDRDAAGDAMRSAIIRSCEGKGLLVMSVTDDAKDPGEMSEQEIQYSYNNKQLIIGGW
jgi:DNA primase